MSARYGFVLGKFMPPHRGHVFLCNFAQEMVEQLTILVCSLPDDTMPGAHRFAWMRELFPRARVLWCNEVVPQAPEDDPQNFWPIWRELVRRYHPEPIDVVFASEDYGHRLAAEVGARFAPCDTARAAAPISATAIRGDPFAHWNFIPECVRPYYVKRVCVFGPESSGKTTLATALAAHLDTALVPEYGRLYTEQFGLELGADDLLRIAKGHWALSRAARRMANRLLVEDTDPLLTAVWSDMLLSGRHPWFTGFVDPADLYLLCDVDFAWVDDGTRYFPDAATRNAFFDACKRELDTRGLRYEVLSGSPEARFARALEVCATLIGETTR